MGSGSCVQHQFPTRLSTEGCFPAPVEMPPLLERYRLLQHQLRASGLQVEFRKAPCPAPCVQV